jgi:hypothetical protein
MLFFFILEAITVITDFELLINGLLYVATTLITLNVTFLLVFLKCFRDITLGLFYGLSVKNKWTTIEAAYVIIVIFYL